VDIGAARIKVEPREAPNGFSSLDARPGRAQNQDGAAAEGLCHLEE